MSDRIPRLHSPPTGRGARRHRFPGAGAGARLTSTSASTRLSPPPACVTFARRRRRSRQPAVGGSKPTGCSLSFCTANATRKPSSSIPSPGSSCRTSFAPSAPSRARRARTPPSPSRGASRSSYETSTSMDPRPEREAGGPPRRGSPSPRGSRASFRSPRECGRRRGRPYGRGLPGRYGRRPRGRWSARRGGRAPRGRPRPCPRRLETATGGPKPPRPPGRRR